MNTASAPLRLYTFEQYLNYDVCADAWTDFNMEEWYEADRQRQNKPVRTLTKCVQNRPPGKAKVLTQLEIQQVFTEGLVNVRDKTLCTVMLYTACRLKEYVTLKIKDVYDLKNKVRPELIIRKGNTKGKLPIRSIPVLDDLRWSYAVSRALLFGWMLASCFLSKGSTTQKNTASV